MALFAMLTSASVTVVGVVVVIVVGSTHRVWGILLQLLRVIWNVVVVVVIIIVIIIVVDDAASSLVIFVVVFEVHCRKRGGRRKRDWRVRRSVVLLENPAAVGERRAQRSQRQHAAAHVRRRLNPQAEHQRLLHLQKIANTELLLIIIIILRSSNQSRRDELAVDLVVLDRHPHLTGLRRHLE